MKNKPKEAIAKGLSLPRDVVFGDFIITLTGNCEAYIENYRGIVSYDENKISIQGNHVVLNICGCDLEVDFYSQESSQRISDRAFFESLCKKSSCIVGIKTSIRRLCVFYQTKFLSNVGSISRESKC